MVTVSAAIHKLAAQFTMNWGKSVRSLDDYRGKAFGL